MIKNVQITIICMHMSASASNARDKWPSWNDPPMCAVNEPKLCAVTLSKPCFEAHLVYLIQRC